MCEVYRALNTTLGRDLAIKTRAASASGTRSAQGGKFPLLRSRLVRRDLNTRPDCSWLRSFVASDRVWKIPPESRPLVILQLRSSLLWIGESTRVLHSQ